MGSQASSSLTASLELEIASGRRFAFGRNWQRFLRVVDDSRIAQAQESLRAMLREDTLAGRRFLDIGSGSGLFSLAARRLGAVVHSFDVDPESVACAMDLRRRYCRDDPSWTIEEGSVLDEAYVSRLGTFDVVYSWGVLHHTGRMWDAIDAASRLVDREGKLFLAIYNDLGTRTRRWRTIKRICNRLPPAVRPLYTAVMMAPAETKTIARMTLRARPWEYVRLWATYNERGMSRWCDMLDWVGGYPYEAATPEAVFDFCRDRGFTLVRLRCGGVGLGCNQFVFQRER